MKETDKVFPVKSDFSVHFGISARDYIAIQAMAGFCADSKLRMDEDEIAAMAYKQADAMIKRSEK